MAAGFTRKDTVFYYLFLVFSLAFVSNSRGEISARPSPCSPSDFAKLAPPDAVNANFPANFDALIKNLQAANPDFEIQYKYQALAFHRKGEKFGFVIGFDRNGEFREVDRFTGLEALLGKKQASIDEVLSALEQRDGLTFPPGSRENLSSVLSKQYLDKVRQPMLILTKLRDALYPMIEGFIARPQRLDPAIIRRDLDEVAKSTKHQVLRYDAEFQRHPRFGTTPSTEDNRLTDTLRSIDFNSRHNDRTVFRENLDKFSGEFSEFRVSIANEQVPQGMWESAFEKGSEDGGKVRKFMLSAVTPIGEYGPEFAQSVQATTQVLLAQTMRDMKTQSASIVEKNSDLLRKHTARGISGSGQYAPLDTTAEGVVSISQTINQLMAQKMVGRNDYRAALREIIFPQNPGEQNGLLNKYVQNLSMGMVGPLTMKGRYFPKPVVQENGMLKLNEELVTLLRGFRHREQDQLASLRGDAPSSSNGIGCPFAFVREGDRKTGIQKMAEAYYEAFVQVDDKLKTAKPQDAQKSP